MTFRREQINFQVAPHVLGISLIFNTDQIVIDFPHTLQYTCSTYLATHDTHQKHQKGKGCHYSLQFAFQHFWTCRLGEEFITKQLLSNVNPTKPKLVQKM